MVVSAISEKGVKSLAWYATTGCSEVASSAARKAGRLNLRARKGAMPTASKSGRYLSDVNALLAKQFHGPLSNSKPSSPERQNSR